MLYPFAYNTGIVMLIALSYTTVGAKTIYDWLWYASPQTRILSSHIDSEEEVESDAVASPTPLNEAVTEEGDSNDNTLVVTDKVMSLIERDNESLREANEAWFERASILEREKRDLLNDKLEVINKCMMVFMILSMLFMAYGTVIYIHLLGKIRA